MNNSPIWLDFRASTGQISRMHVKEHIATANPRIRGFFIYEINVQSEADPNRTGNACSSRGAIVLFVPVCYSAQNSWIKKKEKKSEEIYTIITIVKIEIFFLSF